MSLCPGVKTFTRASQFVFLLPRWYNKVTKGRIAISFLPEGFSSVQFSRSVVSDSLRTHELQHARPPCPSPTPGVHSNSCPSSRWCHPAIPSSVVPFSSCPHAPPASESFPMSQLCIRWPKTGVSALASFLPKNTQDWSPLEWTGWLSLQSKGLSRVFSNTRRVRLWQNFSLLGSYKIVFPDAHIVKNRIL